MFSNNAKVLVLAPHTDDGEFGCGASINKLIEQGCDVMYVAFSTAEQSVSSEWPPDVLQKEVKQATKVLGIPEKRLLILNHPVRNFLASRQGILEEMIQIKIKFDPDVVFLPSLYDTHQDHQVIAQEGFRAFKQTSMLGYELPWNNLTFRTNFFVLLEEKHLQKKIEALGCYASQQSRPYASEQFIRSLAVTRGTQIAATYAEVFESIRWVWR